MYDLVLDPFEAAFRSRDIGGHDIYRTILRLAVTAGIPRHISPHPVGVAAITNALDAGDLRRLASLIATLFQSRTQHRREVCVHEAKELSTTAKL